ncbi:MAG: ABC transporter ATP-binding protein, partial [Paraburkholderia caledonica]
KEASKDAAKDSAKDSAASKDGPAGRNTQRAAKLSFKEQRELEALPEKIAALEAEQKAIGAQLEDSSIFAKDAQEGKRLSERYAAIDEELLLALERWDELEKRRK